MTDLHVVRERSDPPPAMVDEARLLPDGAMRPAATLLRAGLLTALIDGLFSSVLSAGFYGSTVARLWQGVASTLLGPAALDSGGRTVAIGLAMHVGVAFAWSGIFLGLFRQASWLRALLASPRGAMTVAAIFGPLIWMTMSFVIVPALSGRPPNVTLRWWVQFFGHIPFVAIPIVLSVRSAGRRW